MSNGQQQPQQPAGVLVVDKPQDWTSHDVVKFVRGFGIKKVGHCGTLDPMATGVLVLVMGRATKLTERFSKQDKVYQGTMLLGIVTDSHDADGQVIAQDDTDDITEDDVLAVLDDFRGEIMQVPPMLSAKKQGGKKLYELARQGIEVKRDARPVEIHELEVLEMRLPEVDLRVHCSKGTYVRTLAHDIGATLGCGAHLNSLRRIRSGQFSIDQAVTIDQLREWDREDIYANFIPLEAALDYL